ncbi:amidohydrolase [Candidatus Korobacter versatilis]|uniref:amidohydrolase n=1 Tax=Candidatus Korobacter versatilis TaxID=658062 RepID=UPI00030EE9D7|nr:amidohydrolase [Candidatus Koribacter versatilis]
MFPEAKALYVDLHEHPELSSHEERTASVLAGKLRALGYEVTEHVGGTGIVAILKNGAGPTVMLRTELDALPVLEQTGLPFASKVQAKDGAGHDVPVMHACGHDLHMSALFGTAEIMAKAKNTWQGTLMLVGQPAEETISGAKRMLADGLFTRFPKPDVAVALHDANEYSAGQVGYVPGFFNASADSIRITVYGRGGHGSRPDVTIDPVLIAASITVRLQSIVAREIKPGVAAVVTVGYIHAGTKGNIIPDEAEMGLTLRARDPKVRAHLVAAVERVAKAEAEAAGVETMPKLENFESTPSVYNDKMLAAHIVPVLDAALGKGNVAENEPIMGSEDFAEYVNAGVPGFYFQIGASDPEKLAAAKAQGKLPPGPHSSKFAPVLDSSLNAGITAEVAVLRNLLQGTPADVKNFTEHK